MEIKNAIEGRKICDTIRNDLRSIRFNPDLNKMLSNLENMVTSISKAEVECRRAKTNSFLEKPLSEFNKAADHLRKLVLMAQLMD